jgi:hypothetical protein
VSLQFPLEEVCENGGPIVVAHLMVCDCEEGSDVFHIYQVAGQTHFHIECAQCEKAYCPFLICNAPPPPDPVHWSEGDWYFWDETWAARHGPFDSERVARERLKMYTQWLEDGRPTT